MSTIYQADGTTVMISETSDYSHELFGSIFQLGTTAMCSKSKLDGLNRYIWAKLYSATGDPADGDWWD